MLQLVVGTPISEPLVAELRRCLPNLPPGSYYVSSALRVALFHELVRFYAAVEFHAETNKTRPAPRSNRLLESEEQVQDAEIVVGSPRDTPFLRRKALETIESKTRQRNRRHLFTSGGVAILQASTFTSTTLNSR
ncbi:Vacuolar sorting protein/ubiquitin receptor VPS23 [Phytophthora cinnamomi]|nr:Vacuolar sorting protein/ubiquitin receptor VPS23 [Phytophthora cinnamomi]